MAHANLQILINVSPVMKEVDPVPTTIHLRTWHHVDEKVRFDLSVFDRSVRVAPSGVPSSPVCRYPQNSCKTHPHFLHGVPEQLSYL